MFNVNDSKIDKKNKKHFKKKEEQHATRNAEMYKSHIQLKHKIIKITENNYLLVILYGWISYQPPVACNQYAEKNKILEPF